MQRGLLHYSYLNTLSNPLSHAGSEKNHLIIFQTSAQNVSQSKAWWHLSAAPDQTVWSMCTETTAQTQILLSMTHTKIFYLLLWACALLQQSLNQKQTDARKSACVCVRQRERNCSFPLISASDPHWLLLNKKSRKEVAKSCWNWREGINLNQAWRSPSLLPSHSSFLFLSNMLFSLSFPCKIIDLWNFLFISSFICQSTHSSCHPSTHLSICSFINPSIHLLIHSFIHHHLLLHPSTHPSAHSFIHPSAHLFIHSSSSHSFIHPSIIRSFIHPWLDPERYLRLDSNCKPEAQPRYMSERNAHEAISSDHSFISLIPVKLFHFLFSNFALSQDIHTS